MLTLKQENETSIIVSWISPVPVGDTIGYRLYWVKCRESEHDEVLVNDGSVVQTLTNLMKGQCYNISVAGVSEHLPSEVKHSTITLGQFFLFSLSWYFFHFILQ